MNGEYTATVTVMVTFKEILSVERVSTSIQYHTIGAVPLRLREAAVTVIYYTVIGPDNYRIVSARTTVHMKSCSDDCGRRALGDDDNSLQEWEQV